MDRIRNSLNYTKWKLIIINLLGFALFIFLAPKLWAPAGREGFDYFDEVTAFIWGLTVLPPLVLCMLVNLILVREILVGAIYYQRWMIFVLWIIIVAIWGFAVKYDLSRHYNGSELPPRDSSVAPRE